jgi:hypothetical protein
MSIQKIAKNHFFRNSLKELVNFSFNKAMFRAKKNIKSIAHAHHAQTRTMCREKTEMRKTNRAQENYTVVGSLQQHITRKVLNGRKVGLCPYMQAQTLL